MLDKLLKRISRTDGPLLAASLGLLAHHRNVARLSLFCRYYVRLNCLNWFHVLILGGGLLVFLIDWMIFLSPFLDVIIMSKSKVFPRTTRLWNCVSIEFFPLTYDLTGFKSRIKRHHFLQVLSKALLHNSDCNPSY